MAIVEVNSTQRAAAPYAMVGMLETTWPDGRISIGTCALVGSNDVLTAGHCVFDPTYGGFATRFRFYFGADYNSARNLIESPGIAIDSGAPMSIVYNPEIFTDNDPQTFWRYESQYDVALIGLPRELRSIGSLALDFSQDKNDILATEVGYPSGSSGMMQGSVLVDRHSIDAVYVSTAASMGPGSSGGPLLSNGAVIGVKSAGSRNGSTWADIGLSEALLRRAMSANDSLLNGSGSVEDDLLIGSIGNDRILASAGNDTIDAGQGNDTIDGGSGDDTVRFLGAYSRFSVSISNGVVSVTDQQRSLGSDRLTEVETLQFSDRWVSTDVAGDSAKAYRVYKAAFDRSPDLEGLGYWIAQMENGMNVVEVAARFVDSAEFRQLYGNSPSPSVFINRLYQNVLDRTPDTTGLNWWINQMQNDPSKTFSKVLADFSESLENQTNVAAQIADGIVYLPYGLA